MTTQADRINLLTKEDLQAFDKTMDQVLRELEVKQELRDGSWDHFIVWADQCPHCFNKVEPKATGCPKCHSSFVD